MSLEEVLLPDFEGFDMSTREGIVIHGSKGGAGPPVLLLHGHPQTHVTWSEVAPRIVEAGYSVVATDLRGYGDSARPPGGADHSGYSKRAMALDQVEVMQALGFERFVVVGHDRGARVAHRMGLDHPENVRALAVLDIAPTATMYQRADREFATRYFWWFFLIQPEPLPERLIASDPEFYLRYHLAGQSRTPGVPSETLIQEYLRCYRQPGTIHSICEDYRAAAGIDLVHDAADGDRKLAMPLLALWGKKGVVGQLYDVLATWREKAQDVRGEAIDCGHALQEEAPALVSQALLKFIEEVEPQGKRR
ncbi:MAG: alpha/beta hydrolase [Burkholderiaceae bacterium]|jgi:haloacetate dehalogenase